MSEKRLTLGELKHQIREIQDYYKLSDNAEIIVRRSRSNRLRFRTLQRTYLCRTTRLHHRMRILGG